MSIKNFLMRKMMSSQLKGVPQEEQDKIFDMIEKNPELFQKIAQETQEKIKSGKDQMSAAMEVMQKYKDQLQKLKSL
jgi:2-oxo-4-hydroxy-4-carboxy--5-ureidoimidazoline (OHCU) decarboxylase